MQFGKGVLIIVCVFSAKKAILFLKTLFTMSRAKTCYFFNEEENDRIFHLETINLFFF